MRPRAMIPVSGTKHMWHGDPKLWSQSVELSEEDTRPWPLHGELGRGGTGPQDPQSQYLEAAWGPEAQFQHIGWHDVQSGPATCHLPGSQAQNFEHHCLSWLFYRLKCSVNRLDSHSLTQCKNKCINLNAADWIMFVEHLTEEPYLLL